MAVLVDVRYILEAQNHISLTAWCNYSFGNVGDGITIDNHTPIQIGTASNWSMVSASGNHNVAVNMRKRACQLLIHRIRSLLISIIILKKQAF